MISLNRVLILEASASTDLLNARSSSLPGVGGRTLSMQMLSMLIRAVRSSKSVEGVTLNWADLRCWSIVARSIVGLAGLERYLWSWKKKARAKHCRREIRWGDRAGITWNSSSRRLESVTVWYTDVITVCICADRSVLFLL